MKDTKGLIHYLAQKINIGLLCLYCENKGTKDFKYPEAVQSHMLDKGHCFIGEENLDEFKKFYDINR